MESSDLKRLGLKVTHPRMKILELLETAESRHMSAEEVYKALSNAGEEIGLATVYRVLTQFETAGLVIRHYFENGRILSLSWQRRRTTTICFALSVVKLLSLTTVLLKNAKMPLRNNMGSVLKTIVYIFMRNVQTIKTVNITNNIYKISDVR